MNISKKYIKRCFKSRGMQLNDDALNMLEERLKMLSTQYSRLCNKFGYKRVTKDRIEKVFDFEDSFEKG
tara:strand:- start:85 stop:291 length:207 start_codon:yes stop_codon:yes gene_type:complete